jgi:hypothetical protein
MKEGMKEQKEQWNGRNEGTKERKEWKEGTEACNGRKERKDAMEGWKQSFSDPAILSDSDSD